MRASFVLSIAFFAVAGFAQTAATGSEDPPAPATPVAEDQQQQQQPPASTSTDQQPTTPEGKPIEPHTGAERSVLAVQPGGEALKNKDFYERSGYFHPFLRMPKYILADQKRIWTSPFHTSKSDIKWWLILGGATGALIATDKYSSGAMGNSSTQVHLGQDFSNIGAAYTLVPLGAVAYFAGTAAGSEHFRETGLLTFEALVDTTLVEVALKAATQRARPLESDGKGHFWDSKASRWNSSFPSGHTINTFAIASVFAHEFHTTRWPVYVAYGFAGLVSGARLAGRNHFPGDVMAGAAMGWFIGDYVYGKRHNPDIYNKSVSQRILDHVHFGLALQ